MDRLINGIIMHRKAVVAVFVVLAIVSACCIPFVKTNYNLIDYLPDSAQSTTAVRLMEEGFSQDIPNANVMVRDVTIPEALAVKQALEDIEGVETVMWLDDVADLDTPLETQDASLVEPYYKPTGADRGIALFQVSVADGTESSTVPAMRALVDEVASAHGGTGGGNAVSGDASNTAQMQASTVEEVVGAVIIIVPIILFLLIVSTMSWIEPALFIAAIGVSILLNMGTNIFLGEVSFITYSVSPILQLAVSLDYAIFLLHAFSDARQRCDTAEEAMARAWKSSVSTITSSAVTTLFGFAALAFMQFQIGADLGINLVKGIIFSLGTVIVFLPALTLVACQLIDKTAHRKFMPSFKRADRVFAKVRVPALVIVLVLVVPAFLGQSNASFTYQNAEPDPSFRSGADQIAVTDEFGHQNAAVVLVPRGDVVAEGALARDLEALADVKSVMAYATTVGPEIPVEFVGQDVIEQFYSDDWARIIAYLDTDVESDEAFAAVQEIQDVAAAHYDEYYVAGESANLYDMSQIVAVDNVRVSLVAVVAIFLVLIVTFRSLSLPLILLLTIEAGIWINLSIPYFMGESLNFIGYLVINTVQLGATIDYGILLTTHYMRLRRREPAALAMRHAIAAAFPSLLVSALILSTAGFALGVTSSLSAVQSPGILLGRGALISLAMVTCFLPGLLVYLDGFVRCLTWRAGFYARRLPERKMEDAHARFHEDAPRTLQERPRDAHR